MTTHEIKLQLDTFHQRVVLSDLNFSSIRGLDTRVEYDHDLRAHLVTFIRKIPKELLKEFHLSEVPSTEYPRDWWQAFRERWFPRWWLKRYPVKHTYVPGRPAYTVDVGAYYPDVVLPGHEPIIALNMTQDDLEYFK